MSKMLERIERQAGVPGLVAILAERLIPSALTSLLLEVYARRAGKRTPAQLLADYERDRFVQPSRVSALQFLEWEQVALSHLPAGFEALVLAPVCPLGTSSVLAGLDQDWAVSTSRNTEVVSDATNVLALEAAVRRRNLLKHNPRSARPVHLAASHRLLRPQAPAGPQQLAHFDLFALVSAGRDQGSWEFETTALETQIRFYLEALRAFLGKNSPLRVSVGDFSSTRRWEWIEQRILAPIRVDFENLECQTDPVRTHGRGYYTGLCLHIHAITDEGEEVFLADGGEVNWTQALVGSAKERLVISGIGSERLCAMSGVKAL